MADERAGQRPGQPARAPGAAPPTGRGAGRPEGVAGRVGAAAGTWVASASHSSHSGVAQAFRGGCGCLSLGFGLVMAAVGLGGLATSTTVQMDIAMVLALGLVPAGLGAWLLTALVRGHREASRQREERLILRVAAQLGGVVTPVQVVRQTPLSLDQARTRLEAMAAAGYTEREVTEAGTTCYHFHELMPGGTRPLQVDLLEQQFEQVEQREAEQPQESEVGPTGRGR